jgi:hypothetical protein
MKALRALFTIRKSRNAGLEESFTKRLERLDRNRATVAPRLVLFKNRSTRLAA